MEDQTVEDYEIDLPEDNICEQLIEIANANGCSYFIDTTLENIVMQQKVSETTIDEHRFPFQLFFQTQFEALPLYGFVDVSKIPCKNMSQEDWKHLKVEYLRLLVHVYWQSMNRCSWATDKRFPSITFQFLVPNFNFQIAIQTLPNDEFLITPGEGCHKFVCKYDLILSKSDLFSYVDILFQCVLNLVLVIENTSVYTLNDFTAVMLNIANNQNGASDGQQLYVQPVDGRAKSNAKRIRIG